MRSESSYGGSRKATKKPITVPESRNVMRFDVQSNVSHKNIDSVNLQPFSSFKKRPAVFEMKKLRYKAQGAALLKIAKVKHSQSLIQGPSAEGTSPDHVKFLDYEVNDPETPDQVCNTQPALVGM